MAKVDLETVQKILKENGVDVRVAAEILNQLRDVIKEEAVEREKPAKKQMLVLVSEPEEGLPKDLTGWVVQLLEDDDPREVADKIVEVAKAFKIYYKKVEGKTPTSYTMDHSAGSYTFDAKGRVRLYNRYGSGAQALADDVKLLLKGV